jgi:hypothetical protein
MTATRTDRGDWAEKAGRRNGLACARAPRIFRLWTADEDERLARLAGEYSCREIASMMQRKESAVSQRASLLGISFLRARAWYRPWTHRPRLEWLYEDADARIEANAPDVALWNALGSPKSPEAA